jgi:hypothetical protein
MIGRRPLSSFPGRMFRRHHPDSIERKGYLEIDGLLAPERPVIVEYGDPLRRPDEIRAAGCGHPGHEVCDRLACLSLVPGRKRISPPGNRNCTQGKCGAQHHSSCSADTHSCPRDDSAPSNSNHPALVGFRSENGTVIAPDRAWCVSGAAASSLIGLGDLAKEAGAGVSHSFFHALGAQP